VAEAAGYDSLWLSDHLFLSIAKYGGSDERHGALEPIAALAALAGVVSTARLGTLVLCEALRPPTVAAKALATLDLITGGRLDVGLGAGWYEPDYEAIGMKMPAPGERLDRLEEALTIITGLLGGGPVSFDGQFHRAVDARNLPPALQEPRPRVFVGGKGDRLLRIAATHADGWNTCWAWTPAAYRERLDVLERACGKVGRDPATVWRTLGLYALCGADQKDLARRFERMRAVMPAGVVPQSLAEWRVGRLVGTVDEVREQARVWADDLGVETLILGAGPLPFAVTALDELDSLAAAVIDR
jgi:alkanesulfonate monooxygenase SsuD/methylene tetrahydromethanopterin reductase-like flavin-dependent oxidoreductase (luciferase family)